MPGTVTLTRRNEVSIHTYTSPEAGRLVNTHIIELPTQLLVIDAHYTLTFAREVIRYAETLEKPITRVYISHYRYSFWKNIDNLPEVRERTAQILQEINRYN